MPVQLTFILAYNANDNCVLDRRFWAVYENSVTVAGSDTLHIQAVVSLSMKYATRYFFYTNKPSIHSSILVPVNLTQELHVRVKSFYS